MSQAAKPKPARPEIAQAGGDGCRVRKSNSGRTINPAWEWRGREGLQARSEGVTWERTQILEYWCEIRVFFAKRNEGMCLTVNGRIDPRRTRGWEESAVAGVVVELYWCSHRFHSRVNGTLAGMMSVNGRFEC